MNEVNLFFGGKIFTHILWIWIRREIKASRSACLFSTLCEFHVVSIKNILHYLSYKCYDSKSVLIVLTIQVKNMCVYIYIVSILYCHNKFKSVYTYVYYSRVLTTLNLSNCGKHTDQS